MIEQVPICDECEHKNLYIKIPGMVYCNDKMALMTWTSYCKDYKPPQVVIIKDNNGEERR